MTGSLSILNCGAGDIEVRFNQHQPDEVKRAVTMLKDMMRRGYAILVKNDDGSYSRASNIDGERGLYIISEPEPVAAEQEPVVAEAAAPKRRGRPRGPQRRTASIAGSHAVSVGRSAGG